MSEGSGFGPAWVEQVAARADTRATKRLAVVLANLGGSGEPFAVTIETLNACCGAKSTQGKQTVAARGIAALLKAGLIEVVRRGVGGRQAQPTSYRLVMPTPPFVTAPSIPPTKAAPRPLTPAARRLINEKLADVYDDTTGYVAPWTDKRLAEELGCPLVWVAEVRELMFGPLKVNPVIEAEAAAAIEVVNRVSERLDVLVKQAGDLAALQQEMSRDLAAIEAEIVKLRADLDGARAAVRRVEEAVRP